MIYLLWLLWIPVRLLFSQGFRVHLHLFSWNWGFCCRIASTRQYHSNRKEAMIFVCYWLLNHQVAFLILIMPIKPFVIARTLSQTCTSHCLLLQLLFRLSFLCPSPMELLELFKKILPLVVYYHFINYQQLIFL